MATRFLQILLTFLVPILLVLCSVRVALTETWLKFEYNRAGFPEDRYGWDKATRLEYGHYGIRYLLNDENIDYLADSIQPEDDAYTQRELDHMEDVKTVTKAALTALIISLILFFAGATALAVKKETRINLAIALMRGGMNTLVIIFVLLLTAVLSWDLFFDSFHALFFQEGTWQFYNSDTLIRLYPQQFWFDSSLLVGGLTIGGALLCAFLPRFWLRQFSTTLNSNIKNK